MAKVIWSEPAAADFDEIIEYIALHNPDAAEQLAQRIIRHTRQLVRHPLSGPVIPELFGSRYRQISEHPCRIIYLYDGNDVRIMHVARTERPLRISSLQERE